MKINKEDQFNPNPLQCQKFGHHKDVCRGEYICKRCGMKSPDHDQNECTKNPKCANCRQDHPATACPIWQKEKKNNEVESYRISPLQKPGKLLGTISKKELC